MIRELERRQDQLIQEKKLSSLGVLTSGIAHQLNNPPQQHLHLLPDTHRRTHPVRSGVCGQNAAQYLARGVARRRDIVKGLLEFARAKDFRLQRVPLDEVAAKAFRLVSSQMPCLHHLDQTHSDRT